MALLVDGLKLMVAGMGTVFLFLVIMTGWMKVSAILSARFEHLLPDDAAPEPRGAQPRPRGPAPDDGRLTAVIMAAIQMYRREHTPR